MVRDIAPMIGRGEGAAMFLQALLTGVALGQLGLTTDDVKQTLRDIRQGR